MKIGINCQNLSRTNYAGVEYYTLHLIKSLSRLDTDNSYVLYFDQSPSNDLWNELSGGNKNFSFTVIKSFLSWTHLGLSLHLWFNPVDILFSTIHTIPLLLPPSIKKISVIHGLEYKYANPTDILQKLLLGKTEKLVSTLSQRVIVPSNFTKQEIIKMGWGVAEKNLVVIPEGVDLEFYNKPSVSVIEQAKAKYDINSDYVFFVSTIDPRKNIKTLIDGFVDYLKKSPAADASGISLVVAGKSGPDYENVLSHARSTAYENRIKFIGRVDARDLPALYFGAKVFSSASLEEGFGLHLLEAMAAGIPCVVSNIPSYREIAGSLVIYFDNKFPSQLSKGLEVACGDNQLVKDLVFQATERAKIFTWDKTALGVLAVFKSI